MPEAEPDRPGQWRDDLTRRIIVWALAVFAASSFALVLLFALSTAANIYANLFDWSVGFGAFNAFTSRSYEPLLIVAGASLILLLMVRTENAFVVGFGILVVAALVVPSKDIIRFATILTGSEATFAEFYPQGGEVGYRQRARDLALRLVERVEETLEPDQPIDGLREDVLIRDLTDEIENARIDGLIDRLSRTGAITILRDFHSLPNLVERFESDERFVADLEYLRREGLITYMYDDIEGARSTRLGTKLQLQLSEELQRAEVGSLGPSFVEAPAAMSTVCPEIEPEIVTEEAVVADDPRTVRLGPEASVVPIASTEEAPHLFVSLVSETDGVDPFLCLYSGDGLFIYSDDDSAGGLGARLEVLPEDFTGGRVFIALLSIGQPGEAMLSARRNNAATAGVPGLGG